MTLVKLLKVEHRKGPVYAELEISARTKGSIQRQKFKVRRGTNLCKLSGYRDVYAGYQIDDIYCGKGHEHITFTGNSEVLRLGQTINEVEVQRYFIKAIKAFCKYLKVLMLLDNKIKNC